MHIRILAHASRLASPFQRNSFPILPLTRHPAPCHHPRSTARRVCRMDRAPDSVAASLPHLWTRVLFPAPAPGHAGRPSLPCLLVLLLLPAALLYPCLGFALFEP